MEVGEIIGDLLGILSVQIILISMELGSKNSLMVLLQNKTFKKSVQDSLKTYLNHAVIAMFVFSLYMYILYGISGMIIGIVTNSIIIAWIYTQYCDIINVC